VAQLELDLGGLVAVAERRGRAVQEQGHAVPVDGEADAGVRAAQAVDRWVAGVQRCVERLPEDQDG
jgi:hypothetical protein